MRFGGEDGEERFAMPQVGTPQSGVATYVIHIS